MMNATATKTRTAEHALADAHVSKGALTALGTVAGVIGLWAAACLVSGMVASGGPISLIRTWFSAVTGV